MENYRKVDQKVGQKLAKIFHFWDKIAPKVINFFIVWSKKSIFGTTIDQNIPFFDKINQKLAKNWIIQKLKKAFQGQLHFSNLTCIL